MTDSRYTEGVWGDGAAILLDGQPLAIHLIVEGLNERDALRERLTNAEAALASERRVADEVEADLSEALEVVRRIREARVKHGATGFPVGLYPDPAKWMEEQCDALLTKHGAKQ